MRVAASKVEAPKIKKVSRNLNSRLCLQAPKSQKSTGSHHTGEVVDPQDLRDFSAKSDSSNNEQEAEFEDKISMVELFGLKAELELAMTEIKALRALSQQQKNIIEEKDNIILEIL